MQTPDLIKAAENNDVTVLSNYPLFELQENLKEAFSVACRANSIEFAQTLLSVVGTHDITDFNLFVYDNVALYQACQKHVTNDLTIIDRLKCSTSFYCLNQGFINIAIAFINGTIVNEASEISEAEEVFGLIKPRSLLKTKGSQSDYIKASPYQNNLDAAIKLDNKLLAETILNRLKELKSSDLRTQPYWVSKLKSTFNL